MAEKGAQGMRGNLPARVAVIGAGLMGHGIAQVFAMHGCHVWLQDVDKMALQGAQERIVSNLKLFVEAGIENESIIDETLSRISMTVDLQEAVAAAAFVTEAVPEDMNLKVKIFRELDGAAPEGTILASNTSMLSMTEIGRQMKKRDRTIITHWFNPSYLVPVVEIVRGKFTSQETFDLTYQILEELGKEPVPLRKEVPGFLVNRIQTAMFREALSLLEAGVASPEDIDKAVKGSFGLRLPILGPLTTADLGGLDLWHKGTKHLYPLLDSSKEPQKVLSEKIEKGFLGAKTGKGFFDYESDIVKGEEQIRDTKLIKILGILYPKKK